MKSFLDHLKEEVLPTVQVADGGLDISKPAVRAAINAAIAGVVSQPAVTPYVVFNRLSKLLAQYHIVLPRRFLEGDKGVEVFELKQFGHKMGMTDSGEFVNEVPSTHYLFLQYGILSPFGITYAKPVVGGMFKVMARVVDKGELDKLMDMAEITMAEEAEQMQAIAKANAPKEKMHTALGDCDCSQGDSPSTKKAIKVSMKKIDEEQIDEVSLAKAAKTARLRNLGAERSAHASPYDYSPHIDVQRRKAGKTVDRIGLKHGDDKAKKVSDKMSKDTDKVWRGKMGEDKDPCWKGYEMIGMKKKGGKPVPNCVPVKEEEKKLYKVGATKKDKSGRTVERRDYSTHSSIVATHDKEGKSLQNKWGGYNPDRVGKPKYIQKHFGKMEEEQLDELTGKGKLPALKAVYKGDKDYHTRGAEYHAARADRAERRGEVGKAERHMDAGYGHEHKAERAEAKSKRASALMTRAKAHADIKASKAASKSARAEYNEETQIDELKKSTLASYIKKAHVSGLEAASQGEIAYANKDKAGLRAANKTGEKREQGIERAAGKLAREETIAEKAPPGAKFERMVKHIKKRYSKDGLTAKEKGIAFATAWKAKNREKGE